MMELKIYKLINSDLVSEFHWDGDCFTVLVNYYNARDFMCELENIFGYGVFDDGGIEAVLKDTYFGFDLTLLDDCTNLEEIFPRED